MAKGSGGTRAIYSSNGKLGILSADAGEMPDRVVDKAFIFASYDDYKEVLIIFIVVSQIYIVLIIKCSFFIIFN